VDCDQSPWQNWSGDFTLTPERHCHPSSLSDLVDIVQKAEAADPQRKVRAAGSSWSLSDAPATPDYLVETRGLHRTLYNVVPDALSKQALSDLTAQPQDGRRYSYYHVEAGVTIRDLCQRLDQPSGRWPLPTHDLAGRHPGLGGRWALATMGGASGQTLAGAISTGTHGSDVELPPMADFVEAVHLVGPSGRQHWIERNHPLTDMEALRAIYPGLEVHHNEQLFNSVLVSVGRMGIIYALVIRVVPQFGLEERRSKSLWSREAPRLLDGSIFTDERFVQVLLNPYATSTGDHVCYVTTRRETTPPANSRASSMPALLSWICRYRTIGQLLVRAICLLLLAILPMRLIPGVRRLLDRILAKAAVCVLLLLPLADESIGDLVARLCNAVNAARQTWVTTALVDRIMAAAQPEEGTGGTRPRTGISYQIAEATGTGVECYRGVSVEVFFDATRAAHIDFVNDDLLPTLDALRRQDGPVLGYVSLRFTRRSAAFLAMQRWDRTCAIEVALLRGVNGNNTVLRQLERAAVLRGGTVHWGQGNTLTAADVRGMYPNYEAWREQLRSLSADGGSHTFENPYCSKRGLVP
jgi:hypothetical protein